MEKIYLIIVLAIIGSTVGGLLFTFLDDWLLSKFYTLTQKLSALTGKSNYTLARLVIVLGTISANFFLFFIVMELENLSIIKAILYYLLPTWIAALQALNTVKELQNIYNDTGEKITVNWLEHQVASSLRRRQYKWIMALMLILPVMNFSISLIVFIYIITFILVAYYIAVCYSPAQKSKVTEAVKNLLTRKKAAIMIPAT